jgi:hypothetical protein
MNIPDEAPIAPVRAPKLQLDTERRRQGKRKKKSRQGRRALRVDLRFGSKPVGSGLQIG